MKLKKWMIYVLRLMSSYVGDIVLPVGGWRYRIGVRLGGYHLARQYPRYLASHNAKRGIESFARQFVCGIALDLGSGGSPLAGCRPIDNGTDENAYHINEQDKSVDFVFSSHCFEHLNAPGDAIKEIGRVLSDTGKVLVYLPHPACELWSQNVNEHHLSFFWPDEWRNLFEKNGFSILEMSYQPDGMMSFYILASRQEN